MELNHGIKRSGTGRAPAVTSTAAQHIGSICGDGEVSRTRGLTQLRFPCQMPFTSLTGELEVTAPLWALPLLLM